jgi:hypothetical protein
MKKIYMYIYALTLACAVIFNSGCSEHGVCHAECSNREDTCMDDCDENYPEGTDELRNCYDYCGNVYYKCIQKCDGITD